MHTKIRPQLAQPTQAPTDLTSQTEYPLTLATGRAFGMSDASLNAPGKAVVVVALFYENGSLQSVHFTSKTVFQPEVATMDVALGDWGSPFSKNLPYFSQIVNNSRICFQTGDKECLPCWRAVREAFSCLSKVRIQHVHCEGLRLVHELANLPTRSGGGTFVHRPHRSSIFGSENQVSRGVSSRWRCHGAFRSRV
jgi:hypothetical protein